MKKLKCAGTMLAKFVLAVLNIRIRKATVCGTTYHAGDAIILPSSDPSGDPVFATIKYMVFLDSADSPVTIHFILEVWQTLLYDCYYHAYEVKKTETIVITQRQGFLDHHPLVVNKVFDPAQNSKLFIRLRYAYVPY